MQGLHLQRQGAAGASSRSDFGVLSDTPGAIAGRVVETAELTPSLEARRLAELDFISGGFIDEARELAGSLRRRFDPAGGAYDALRQQGADGLSSEATTIWQCGSSAARWPSPTTIPACGSISPSPVAPVRPSNWSDRQRAYVDVTASGINAFVRSDEVSNEAKALAVIGDGFRMREIWKPSYRAYRASLALEENATVRDAYEKVLAEHGFRIVSHDVDADLANPRICIDLLRRPAGVAARPCRLRRGRGRRGPGRSSRRSVRSASTASSTAAATIFVSAPVCRRPTASCWPGRPSSTSSSATARRGSASPATPMCCRPGKGPRSRSPRSIPTSPSPPSTGSASAALADRHPRQRLHAPARALQRRYDRRRAGREGLGRRDRHRRPKLNETITTAIPIGDAVPTLKPGVYVITAKAELEPGRMGQPRHPVVHRFRPRPDRALRRRRRPHLRPLAVDRRAGRRRQAEAGRHQQRHPRRGDHRRQRLCPLRARPCARHRRRVAATGRRDRPPTATTPSSTSPARPSICPIAASTAGRRPARSTSS